jgi:conserved oligomeric Golgi complex subunit 1
MAADSIDPKSFKDWEEAFKHPVVSTRKFEKQLRSQAEENRQKLRTIVGSSYRDLLGTADRIIEMKDQIKLVEKGLGAAGGKCKSRAIEKLFSNAAAFDAHLISQSRHYTMICTRY